MNKQWKEAFDQIHAEDRLKDHTMEYLSRKVYCKRQQHFSVFRGFAAAAACLALLFLGGSWLYFTPDAFISIDINPSLELGINRFDKVVSVEGWNEDGNDLADSLDLKYMDYSDAIETLLADQSIKDYLSQDGLMDLTVACENTSRHDEIMENVETCTSGHSNIHCHSGDTQELHEAHEEGLSFGKYRAFLKLKELDPSVTEDDIRDLSMKEIHDLIEEHSNSSSQGSQNQDDSSDSVTSSDTSCVHENGSEDDSGHRNKSGYRHGHHE